MAILVSNDYRIIKIDSMNLSFEKLNKKTNKWFRVGGYYPNLELTCKALKDFIVNESVDNCTNVYELIELLTEIQIKYATIEFEVKECK